MVKRIVDVTLSKGVEVSDRQIEDSGHKHLTFSVCESARATAANDI